MLADIHSHIIPHLDDGAKNETEARGILELMQKDGIETVVATPHFYADYSPMPSLHLENAQKALQSLKASGIPSNPNIILGHEVHYFKGISQNEEITCLKMGNSNYFLLELPYGSFGSEVADEIVDFSLNSGLEIILAHIERYDSAKGFNDVLRVIRSGYALSQIGCDSLTDSRRRKTALKLIKEGFASFIATDAHSTSARPPKMAKALEVIEAKLGRAQRDLLVKNAEDAVLQM